ncbi:hypothetical protein DHEL01_v206732 [Diaporthe helianthi]|uniref:BCL5p n=1 Tax=Diaporthe helianthi TaxID=158607 RepID=A0A2P5HXA1_DIAHE|nr:hypothetical protein DHEL01_v206732 [Diaporthe helianthi]
MLWINAKRGQPPRVPTDDVIPALFFDDSPMSRGKLEIHVPIEYNSNRPAVRFHQVCFETSIKDHPLASKLPKPTATPSIQAGGDVFRGLKARDYVPATLQDYLCSDDPPLELHVFTFSDATVVTLNFPHFCTDAVGLSKLIENWCKILAGRPEEVDAFAPRDPLDSVSDKDGGEGQMEEHVLSQFKLAGWSMLFFALNFISDLIFGPKMETGVIFLPKKSVAALKETTIASIPSNTIGQGGGAAEKPFVSEGDVISAWAIRNISLSLGPRCKRTMAVLNVFELRSRLRQAFNSSTAYVQNAFFVLTTIFTVQEAQTMSLGEIALRLRSSTKEQTSVPQVEALVRDQRASIKKTDRPVVFAERDSILLPFSNWGKARFFDVVDFSPAIVKEGSDARLKRNAPGKPVLFLSCDASPKPNPTYRNVVNIIGKDPSGNYWITGFLSKAAWKEVEKGFKNL